VGFWSEMKVHFFDKDKWSIIDSKDLYYYHDYGQEDLFCNNKKVTGYRLQSKIDKLGLWSSRHIPSNRTFEDFREKLGYTISATPPNIRENGVHYFREDYIPSVKEYINKELGMKFDDIIKELDSLGFELIVKELEYKSVIFDDGKQIVERR
jgi:hypothetical protein